MADRPSSRGSSARPASDATSGVARRIASYDFAAAARDLDTAGYARLPDLLTPDGCAEVVALFDRDELYRKTIDMQRHAYGSGSYRYFASPLPEPITALREALYPPLARIANRWSEVLSIDARYPDSLDAFLATCHEHGQRRPTPLVLRYEAGGYNRMHQDVYGDVAFPLQVACVLSSSGRDFTGGEFLISEGRPRMQTRTTAVDLARGEGIVFANSLRPVASARGHARAAMRHGLSTVRSGVRHALGLIFHDAK